MHDALLVMLTCPVQFMFTLLMFLCVRAAFMYVMVLSAVSRDVIVPEGGLRGSWSHAELVIDPHNGAAQLSPPPLNTPLLSLTTYHHSSSHTLKYIHNIT